MNTENEELKKKLEDALKLISELETENSRLRGLVSNVTHQSDSITKPSIPTENLQKHSSDNSHTKTFAHNPQGLVKK
ncbi:MAG: hypothetical protein PHG32_07310 [Candidatus Cloacimonetes bacterium]|nr:hypothetical protein [Candidatus Cloacimonadota bacterium]